MSTLIRAASQLPVEIPPWSAGSMFNILLLASAAVLFVHNLAQWVLPGKLSDPPTVYHIFPWIGSAVAYGIDPYAFFESARRRHGNVFTFVLLGKRVTVALGTAGNSLVLNGRLHEVNAEEAYTHLTTPVFGEDVVYDVPNHILMQQKRMVKFGLTVENFNRYVPIIAEEVMSYFDGVLATSKSVAIDALKAASEITICTAAATLQGKEVRCALNASFAQLYHDLDGGFTPINFVFPNLPLPSYRRRDRAQLAMRKFYLDILESRRAEGREHDEGDMLSALQGQQYKDGRALSDKEIAHIMIALLMAGQHTSAATGSWLLLHLAANPDLVDELREEQVTAFGAKNGGGGDLDPLDFARLQTPLLNATIKEVLRLHPPIHSILRKVKSSIIVPSVLGSPCENTSYIIPPSHFVMAAPGVSQLDPTVWKDAEAFSPKRWLKSSTSTASSERQLDLVNEEEETEKVDYGFGVISSGANSPYLPFGAGRHRCIGEQFAFLQLGTFVATVIRHFNLELVGAFPGPDYTTMLVGPKKPRQIIVKRR